MDAMTEACFAPIWKAWAIKEGCNEQEADEFVDFAYGAIENKVGQIMGGVCKNILADAENRKVK